MPDDKKLFALLIDGDNAQASLLPQMLTEINKYGTTIIRRIYGDWTEPQMKSWKEVLNTYAIQPMQQFRYTTGKNATDIALIIDAMDILYISEVSGFCIVSSDSDFTRLATRIRESNLFVLGIGRSNTPRAFVNACNVFVSTENLQDNDTPAQNGQSKLPTQMPKKVSSKSKKQMAKLFNTAFELAVQENGWADLGLMGKFLHQIDPGFDPRTYGHKQLSKLVQEYPELIEVRKSGTKNAFYQIRMKS
jgi:predicted nuclease of predicted toxin-antitoxin system